MQAAYPGHIWADDFVEDALADGTPLRILTVMDEFTREGLAILARIPRSPAWTGHAHPPQEVALPSLARASEAGCAVTVSLPYPDRIGATLLLTRVLYQLGVPAASPRASPATYTAAIARMPCYSTANSRPHAT